MTVACPITLKQRPWLTRGLLTALILLSIIALWAAVFLFGLGKVFAGDPHDEVRPASAASFFVVPVEGQVVATRGAAAAVPSRLPAAGRTAGPPTPGVGRGARPRPPHRTASRCRPPGGRPRLGALPKDGTLPGGAGRRRSPAPWSRRPPANRWAGSWSRRSGGPLPGNRQTVSSAATQADGTYQVSGLFPGDYVLKFTAKGFNDVYAASSDP